MIGKCLINDFLSVLSLLPFLFVSFLSILIFRARAQVRVYLIFVIKVVHVNVEEHLNCFILLQEKLGILTRCHNCWFVKRWVELNHITVWSLDNRDVLASLKLSAPICYNSHEFIAGHLPWIVIELVLPIPIIGVVHKSLSLVRNRLRLFFVFIIFFPLPVESRDWKHHYPGQLHSLLLYGVVCHFSADFAFFSFYCFPVVLMYKVAEVYCAGAVWKPKINLLSEVEGSEVLWLVWGVKCLASQNLSEHRRESLMADRWMTFIKKRLKVCIFVLPFIFDDIRSVFRHHLFVNASKNVSEKPVSCCSVMKRGLC